VRSQVEERSFQTANLRHPAGACRAAGRESHHHGESPREGHTGQVITWVQDPKDRNLPGTQVQGGWLRLWCWVGFEARSECWSNRMSRGMGGKRKSLLTWPAVETLFLYKFVRTPGGVQEEYEVEVYVSTSIAISKAVEKEEWG